MCDSVKVETRELVNAPECKWLSLSHRFYFKAQVHKCERHISHVNEDWRREWANVLEGFQCLFTMCSKGKNYCCPDLPVSLHWAGIDIICMALFKVMPPCIDKNRAVILQVWFVRAHNWLHYLESAGETLASMVILLVGTKMASGWVLQCKACLGVNL